MINKVLSKSEYVMFLKHPAWLWLKKYDKGKLPLTDDNLQAVFDSGNLFEKYAEQLFTDVVRLGFNNYDEYLSLPSRTKLALKEGASVISQGRFEADDITCICDVLVKVDEDTFDLFEIKSSTKAKPEHELDLAFQVVVLEACGYKVRNIAVIHVNNEYVRFGTVDAKQITAITDVTKKVNKKLVATKASIESAMQIIALTDMPDISPSLARSDALAEWLTIYRNLVKLEADSIYDLFMPGIDRLGKLESLRVNRLVDIPDDFPVTDKQKFQIMATKLNKEIIDNGEIKTFLSKLKSPLYFLDYETLASVVPHFDGFSPYQQVPFQYSLHVLDSPNGKLSHSMYLHRENSSPVYALSDSLKSNLGKEGSIIVWNESFEKNCNILLGKLAPEFESFYEQVNERIIDLMIPFSKSWYVHKDFGGSASIKRVLPILVPELSYLGLGIHEGATAQRLWMEAVLDGKRESEKDKILSDLEEYCQLDTLAMVEIYKHLIKLE